MSNTNDGKSYEGLGGWLTVWLVFAVITIIRMLSHVDIHSLSGETWAAVTTPGTDLYHPLWKPLLIYEFIFQFLNPMAWLCLFFLCVSKTRRFPKIVVWVYVVSFFLVLLDAVGAYYLMAQIGLDHKPSLRDLGRSIVGLCIWTPYFLRSKRVQATFVK